MFDLEIGIGRDIVEGLSAVDERHRLGLNPMPYIIGYITSFSIDEASARLIGGFETTNCHRIYVPIRLFMPGEVEAEAAQSKFLRPSPSIPADRLVLLAIAAKALILDETCPRHD